MVNHGCYQLVFLLVWVLPTPGSLGPAEAESTLSEVIACEAASRLAHPTSHEIFTLINRILTCNLLIDV